MQTTNTAGGALSTAFVDMCRFTVAQEDPGPDLEVVRPILHKLYVKWDGVNWTDESANVMEASGELRFSPPDDATLLGQGDVGSATIKLSNTRYRYSKLAGSGNVQVWDESLRQALTANRAGIKGVEVKFYQGFMVGDPAAAEYVQIFQGVIYDWNEDSAAKTFDLQLRDDGQKWMQTRVSTPLYKDLRLDQWMTVLADAAGIPADKRAIATSIYTAPWTWADDESATEELWDAGQADGGRVYWDQLGVTRFETLLHWVDKASVWTFTADDFQNLAPAPRPDMLATEVLAQWQPRLLKEVGVVYSLDERKVIGPGETATWDARFSQPVWSLATQVVGQDYHFASSGGANMNDQAVIVLSNKMAQRATVSVTNKHGQLPMMVLHFQLQGVKLEGGPSQEITVQASTPPLATKTTRTMRGNPLIQSDAHARALATFLAERNSRVQPIWRLSGVAGVPQLELSDRVTFSDARIAFAPRDGHVMSISWRSGSDFSQDVEVLDREYLFPHDDYFVIGETALGGGRAWY